MRHDVTSTSSANDLHIGGLVYDLNRDATSAAHRVMDHGKAIKHCTLGKNTGKRVGGFVGVGGR